MYPDKRDLHFIAHYYREKNNSLDKLWWGIILSFGFDGFVLSETLPPFLGDNALLWWGLLPLCLSFILGRPGVRGAIVHNYLFLRNALHLNRNKLLWGFIGFFALACIALSFRAVETQNYAQLVFSAVFFLGTFSSIWQVLRDNKTPEVGGNGQEVLVSVQCYLVIAVIQMFSARLCSLAGAVISQKAELGIYYYLIALACSVFLIVESKPALHHVWRSCPRCSLAFPQNLFVGPCCKYCKLSERS